MFNNEIFEIPIYRCPQKGMHLSAIPVRHRVII